MLEGETALRRSIEQLQMALQFGYESNSSPVVFLCEAASDICLQLSLVLNEGQKEKQKNPEIKFLDTSDALGNPKSIKIFPKGKVFWDPEQALFIKNLASFFIKVKNQDSDAIAFMAKAIGVQAKTPPENIKEQDEQETKVTANIAKIAEIAYHRRRRKKRSISKHTL